MLCVLWRFEQHDVYGFFFCCNFSIFFTGFIYALNLSTFIYYHWTFVLTTLLSIVSFFATKKKIFLFFFDFWKTLTYLMFCLFFFFLAFSLFTSCLVVLGYKNILQKKLHILFAVDKRTVLVLLGSEWIKQTGEQVTEWVSDNEKQMNEWMSDLSKNVNANDMFIILHFLQFFITLLFRLVFFCCNLYFVFFFFFARKLLFL